MSISKRAQVLEKSLEIEHQLSELIKMVIRIPQPTTKTLDNRSTSLSFKTKVDLLFDLEIIDKEAYQKFLLFMEIRNQFVHNIHADSFTYVLDFIANGSKNKLLNGEEQVKGFYDEIKDLPEERLHNYQEGNLEFAFQFLFIHLKKIISRQGMEVAELRLGEFKKKLKDETAELTKEALKCFESSVDEFGDLFSKILIESYGSDSEFKKFLIAHVHKRTLDKLAMQFPDLFESSAEE